MPRPDSPFARVPHQIIRCGDLLDPTEFRVFLGILSWIADDADDGWLFTKTLASGQKNATEDRGCGLSLRQVRRVIRRLERKGVLKAVAGRGRTASRFEINWHFFRPSNTDTPDRIRELNTDTPDRIDGAGSTVTDDRTIRSHVSALYGHGCPHNTDTCDRREINLRTKPENKPWEANTRAPADGEPRVVEEELNQPANLPSSTKPQAPVRAGQNQRTAQVRGFPASCEPNPTDHQRELAERLAAGLADIGQKANAAAIAKLVAAWAKRGHRLEAKTVTRLLRLLRAQPALSGQDYRTLFQRETFDASGLEGPRWKKLLHDHDAMQSARKADAANVEDCLFVIETWKRLGLNGIADEAGVIRSISDAVHDLRRHMPADDFHLLVEAGLEKRASQPFLAKFPIEWFFTRERQTDGGVQRYRLEAAACGRYDDFKNQRSNCIASTAPIQVVQLNPDNFKIG